MVLWLKEWNICEMRNGLLYQKHLDQGRVQRQLALPKDLREMVHICLHNDMGHLGVERTLDLLRSWFYWPRMANAVDLQALCQKKVPHAEGCSIAKHTDQQTIKVGLYGLPLSRTR